MTFGWRNFEPNDLGGLMDSYQRLRGGDRWRFGHSPDRIADLVPDHGEAARILDHPFQGIGFNRGRSDAEGLREEARGLRLVPWPDLGQGEGAIQRRLECEQILAPLFQSDDQQAEVQAADAGGDLIDRTLQPVGKLRGIRQAVEYPARPGPRRGRHGRRRPYLPARTNA